MSALGNHLAAVIARQGEAFSVGPVNSTGIFCTLTPGQAAEYLTDTELAAAGRPIWSAYVSASDGTAVGATVSWNGMSATVARAIAVRLKGATVAKLLVLTL